MDVAPMAGKLPQVTRPESIAMLRPMKPAKLFHAIVVAGAALTACGDDDRTTSDDLVADGGRIDAGGAMDAGSDDAGAAVDAGMSDDAGSEEDAFVAIL